MDTPLVDPLFSTPEQASSPEASPRIHTRRSRVTSDSIADVWTSREPQETAQLPEKLADLGEALDKALNSDGAVSEAYSSFADQAFADPAAIPAASRFVVRLFAGQPTVLVNLVRTKDLLAALEHGSSELPRMIALRWQAGSMTQRISRFGESLILHQDRLKNPAAAEVLAAFAGLLALGKPERAATLFDLATKISDPPGSPEFTADVRAWLSAGQLIETLPVEDRSFWQQLVRKSEADADWSGPEARNALRELGTKLKPAMLCAALFQELVPDSWWREQMEPGGLAEPTVKASEEKLAEAAESAAPTPLESKAEPDSETPSEPSPMPPKTPNVEATSSSPPTEPEAAASVEVPVTQTTESPAGPDSTVPEPPAAEAVLAEKAPSLPATPAKVQASAPSPPTATRSSGVLTFLTGQVLGMALVAGVWAVQPDLLARALSTAQQFWTGNPAPATVTKQPTTVAQGVSTPPQPATAPNPGIPKVRAATVEEKWRAQEIAKLVAARPAMKPWVTKAQEGTWEECGPLVSGRHPTAYPTQEDYSMFLKWLILDPPRDLELRRAVPRLYVRMSTLPDLIDLCEHLSYPGSPNADDVSTMAQIALEMHNVLIQPGERERLRKLAKAP